MLSPYSGVHIAGQGGPMTNLGPGGGGFGDGSGVSGGSYFDMTDPGQFQNIIGNLGQTSGDPNWKQNIKDYNAATGLDVGGRYQGYNAARYLLPAEFQNLIQQYATQAALGPAEQQALIEYMGYVTHPERMSTENRDRLFAQVPELTNQLQKQIASSGGSQAAQQGAAVNVFNNQRRAANDFDASLFSPSGRANTAMGAINVANAARPNLGNLEGLHGITTNTPRNQTGAQIVGGLVGQGLGMASGGIGNLFSGGGGVPVNHNLYSSPIGPTQP